MKGHGRFAVAAAIFLLWSTSALGATRTWTGGTPGDPTCPPANPAWGDPCNWSGRALPAPGDDLVFNGGPSSVNSFPDGTTFNSITLNGHAILGGSRVALNAGLSASGAQISLSAITLNAHQAFTSPTAGQGALITSSIDTNGNVLTLNGAGTLHLAGIIKGSGFVSKRGIGTAVLTNENTYTGSTGVDTGLLLINGPQPQSEIDLEGGMLGGGGTVGPVGVRISPAAVLPGGANNGTDILTVSGNLTFSTGGGKSLKIDLKGTIAGGGHDQVNVTGGLVQLSTANNLEVTLGPGFNPAPGDLFVIINNDGTDGVQGTFAGKPEGSFFTVGQTTFAISYRGGDGNDVVVRVPALRTWDGGGADANWRTKENWVGDVAPLFGDSLEFPAGAAQLNNNNNFPFDTRFTSIIFSGSGYTLNGNGIDLEAGITTTAPTPASSFANNDLLLPLDLTNSQTFTTTNERTGLNLSSLSAPGHQITVAGAGICSFQFGIFGAGTSLVVAGTGTAVLGSSGNPTNFPISVLSGALFIRGNYGNSPVQFGGDLLTGGGTAGPVTATSGTIAPDRISTSTLKVNGGLSMTQSVVFEVDVLNFTGTPNNDRLDVTGAVDLGGSTLKVLTSGSTVGDTFIIIRNDGTDPIVGTFASLPEGSPVVVAETTFSLSYQGGDGNDVTLHVTEAPPSAINLRKLTNGTDNNAPPGPPVPVGSTVTFTFLVTNPGAVPLSSVRVVDDNGTPDVSTDDLNLTSRSGDTNSNNLLDPGETFSFSASRIATDGQHTNVAVARGTPVGKFDPIVATDIDHHFGGTLSSSLGNISTRLRVQEGENVLIGGMIATGPSSKKVIIRAIGPTLLDFGLPGALPDPVLELFQGNSLAATNDDWRSSPQQGEIESSGLAPPKDAESAIIATLIPNQNYTAVVRGKNGETGVGVVEVFDLDPAASARLANISTRGVVEVDDNVMIAGLIVAPSGASNINVLVRALGPTLGDFGVQGFLANPTLDLVSSNGTVIRSNQDWKDSQRAEIEAAQLAPTHDTEAALIESLAPGAYTAVVRGLNRTTGVGLVEVYNIP